MKKFKVLAAAAAVVMGAMSSVGTTMVVGAGAYAVIGAATATMGVTSAQARSVSRSSSSTSSRSVSPSPAKAAPSYTAPAVAPKPAVSNTSTLGTNSSRVPAASTTTNGATNTNNLRPVTPKPAVPTSASASVAPKPMSPPTLSPDRSRIGMNAGKTAPRYVPNSGMTRTWNSTPAQRANNGSFVKPLLIGAAAGLGTAMLYDWLTSPSSTVTTTTAPNVSATTGAVATNEHSTSSISSSGTNLQIVKPAAEFKKFEGSEIPEKYKEIMKKQNLSIEAHEGATEYSKKIKTKSGAEVNIDVGEYPVLVIYMNSEGKPAEALFMPMK